MRALQKSVVAGGEREEGEGWKMGEGGDADGVADGYVFLGWPNFITCSWQRENRGPGRLWRVKQRSNMEKKAN